MFAESRDSVCGQVPRRPCIRPLEPMYSSCGVACSEHWVCAESLLMPAKTRVHEEVNHGSISQVNPQDACLPSHGRVDLFHQGLIPRCPHSEGHWEHCCTRSPIMKGFLGEGDRDAEAA